MDASREDDKKMLMDMSKDELVDLFFMQMRNLWAVDGLYFLGIEDKYDTGSATEIDASVWAVMGKIEARRIKETLGITGGDVPTVMKALRFTSWSLDLEDKEIEIEEDRGIFRDLKCRTQLTRIKKGLTEFPCKLVRWDYLKAFAKEYNPELEVECKVCPPDKHADELWCEWVFKIRQK